MGGTLTRSLRSPAARLLAPARFERPLQIAADPTTVPDEPGIYGWWFDEAPPLVEVTGTEFVDGHWLLYVGIAPSEPREGGRASLRTLRDRLKNHTRGPIASSTLRRTLTALMGEELKLRTVKSPTGKVQLINGGEQVLSAWMETHAVVAWSACSTPWVYEKELILTGPRLPLNIRDSQDPFRHILSSRRRLL